MEKIIFDAEISYGFQELLIQNGLAKKERSDDKVSRVLVNYQTKKGLAKKNIIFQYLLLYDKILLPSRECNIELKENASDFCEIIPFDSSWWSNSEGFTNLAVENLKYFIFGDEELDEKKHYRKDPYKIPGLDDFTQEDIAFLKSIESYLYPYLKTRPEFLRLPIPREHYSLLMGLIERKPSAIDFWRYMAKRPYRDLVAFQCKFHLWRIVEEMGVLKWLMSMSSSYGIPVATPRLKFTKSNSKQYSIYNNQLFSDNNYTQTFQILHNEIKYFPELRTLQDVFNLRDDRRIYEFRTHLTNWSDMLQSGKLDEKDIKAEIRYANNELDALPNLKKIGPLLLISSLPLSVVSLLIKMPLNLCLLPIGYATLYKIKTIERKYNWLFWAL